MRTPSPLPAPPFVFPFPRQSGAVPGLLLVAALAAAAMALAQTGWAQRWGLSPLTLAILLGLIAGNTLFPAIAPRAGRGVDFAKTTLLRTGIVLYGFRVTFQQIAGVGVAGILIDAVMVASVFGLAVWLGTRWFRLDRETSMLIGAGSAICGAAAVMATEPVVKGQAHKVSVAVATVVVFGTLGMFAYPLMYPHLGMSEHAYGVFVGSTVHEVAQVVVAGRSVGEEAAATAVIEKMLRVMMLAPFLLWLSAHLRGDAGDGATASTRRLVIPWFAVLFVAVSGVNSLNLLPASWVHGLVQVDTALLAMAMAALGLRTHAGAIRQAGLKPILLAGLLFGFLVIGGWTVNTVVASVIG